MKPTQPQQRRRLLLLLTTTPLVVGAWTMRLAPTTTKTTTCLASSSGRPLVFQLLAATTNNDNDDHNNDHNNANEWSVSDDWTSLWEREESSRFDSSTLFNQDVATTAALELEQQQQQQQSIQIQKDPDDEWMDHIVDDIYHVYDTNVPLYDSYLPNDTTDQQDQQHFLDAMGTEIAMLVRCNERPQDLLMEEGRALPPLTDDERNNVTQLLLVLQDDAKKQPQQQQQQQQEAVHFVPTDFFRTALDTMFHRHATKDDNEKACYYLDRAGVARWMTAALRESVSPHDRRVLVTLSTYGSYGTGRLVLSEFEQLYIETLVGKEPPMSDVDTPSTLQRHWELRKPYVAAVWRDLRNHGIVSPVEQERQRLAAQLQQQQVAPSIPPSQDEALLMDECEILDWDYREEAVTGDRKEATNSRSSHKTVEMAPPEKKFPLWVRDGDFVFIDEESCIGCMQCANIAPNSFMMLESGRARTFQQRNAPDVKQAVASCPVNCMYPVSFNELRDFETARDSGDGKDDHKYLGHRKGHIPLHVAGMDSDQNRRSSWYHTLKERCLVSKDCPSKGCYDCPKFSKPGENPYFQARHQAAEHARAGFFTEHGDVDLWRKTADL